MSLRYRLFLWVAAIFTVAFVVSYYWEEKATRRNLGVIYQDLLKQLNTINDQKTKAIEEYLSDMLYKIQAEVDAVLLGVAKYQLVRSGFEPTTQNLMGNNWLDSASLMITNKWIDYIQSMNEESLMSEIVIDSNTLNDTIHFPVQDLFHFVGIRDIKDRSKWEGPYIGISLDIGSVQKGGKENGADEDYYVFFTPEQILNFKRSSDGNRNLDLSINLLEPFLKWLELPAQQFYLKDFVDKIEETQRYLKENLSHIPNHSRWMEMLSRKLETLHKDQEEQESCFSLFGSDDLSNESYLDSKTSVTQVKSYVKEYLEHYNKVGLIWGLTTLTSSHVFGRTPLTERSPIGMGMVDNNTQCGKSLLSHAVFSTSPLYRPHERLKNVKKAPSEFVLNHLDIISLPKRHHVFFGNTLHLTSGNRRGFLTVGTHGGIILSSLSRSTHQTSLFVSDGKVIAITDTEGKEIEDPDWDGVPVKQILSESSGVITVKGKEYFFLHIIPYRKLDVHFFIFKPKEEEFALVNSLRKGAKEVVEKISLQMRLASIGGLLFVLILLNNISRRITRPITHLADVTKEVAEGNLEAIQIPEESSKKTHDEIYSLYHSFFQMIRGLREKERVRGILNKVVSEEIAEEALKGNIQLGGEEKRVTVLFADIRGFSAMTEKMDPKEVIHLINTCMTKVSDKIDAHDGVIDKYVGDEVMALFGAPIEKPGSALQAIQSAIDVIEEIKQWNQERKKQGLNEIEMGIGIHTGNVVAGNMGADNRLNYTVLGANVNLAARICSEAGGMEVLISQSTLETEGVEARINYEALKPMQFKGFTEPIPVFSVKGYRRGE